MFRPFLVVALSLFVTLAGARADQSGGAVTDEARVKIQADVEQCHNRQFKSHREAAQCVNEAVQRVLITVNYPYMDLLQLVAGYRIACAQKMDSGELTEADCTKRMGDLRARVTAEESRRYSLAAKTKPGMRPASGPPATDFTAMLKGIAEWSRGDERPAAKPAQIVCFQGGPMISCL